MVVGATGLGKSTLMNTIFAAHLVESKAPKKPSEMASRQTTEIVPITHSVEENGVKVKLTIIDTPGFGDQVNNENWYGVLGFRSLIILKKREKWLINTNTQYCFVFYLAGTPLSSTFETSTAYIFAVN